MVYFNWNNFESHCLSNRSVLIKTNIQKLLLRDGKKDIVPPEEIGKIIFL